MTSSLADAVDYATQNAQRRTRNAEKPIKNSGLAGSANTCIGITRQTGHEVRDAGRGGRALRFPAITATFAGRKRRQHVSVTGSIASTVAASPSCAFSFADICAASAASVTGADATSSPPHALSSGAAPATSRNFLREEVNGFCFMKNAKSCE
ncbi:hypothetical protein BTK97_001021 [Burkholderia multivorans]|nr:hypothetical protein [Burkholderia multivorans]